MSITGAHNIALRFEQVVAAAPAAPAVLCEGQTYDLATYNAFANRLARWLAAQGVRRGQIVCLELPKIIEAYGLAIACIKIGAPYVFLDPDAPLERTGKMIGRCRPSLIISTRDGPGPRITIRNQDERVHFRHEVDGFDAANIAESEQITGTDPAYIMFTSGSTGEPKGAVIPHLGVLHLVDWAADALTIGPGDRLTNVNPLFFDNSVFDLYASLLNGAAVVALNALKGRPPADLVDEITRTSCTFFFAVPTLFMFLDSMRLLTSERLPSVTRFMFGGEGYPVDRLRQFHDAFAVRARLINCYGPTETSCICSGLTLTTPILEKSQGLAPLGRLNPGFSYRILDENLQPVPDGKAGELWLGGPCVALGYLNNPEETERRFCQDPLIDGYRAILYRTGDLVALDAETGSLLFRGRADNQVKLRGYRVELEEVEHAMAAMPGITRALAIVQECKGSSQLVAAFSGERLAAADILAHCRARLPAYMVPSRLVWLDRLPTNANGKADRRALPALITGDTPLAKAS